MPSKYQSQINHIKANYKRIPINVKFDEYEAFKAKTEAEGSSPIRKIREMIREYMRN